MAYPNVPMIVWPQTTHLSNQDEQALSNSTNASEIHRAN